MGALAPPNRPLLCGDFSLRAACKWACSEIRNTFWPSVLPAALSKEIASRSRTKRQPLPAGDRVAPSGSRFARNARKSGTAPTELLSRCWQLLVIQKIAAASSNNRVETSRSSDGEAHGKFYEKFCRSLGGVSCYL